MLSYGVFNFLSADTLIIVDQIGDLLCEGDSVTFEEGVLEGNLTREDLVICLIGVGQVPPIDFSSVEIGKRLFQFRESFDRDFEIHTRWVLCESPEFDALKTWLKSENYFSIGASVFSSSDLDQDEGEVKMVRKYIHSLGENGYHVYLSSDDGYLILENFYKFCKNSFIEN